MKGDKADQKKVGKAVSNATRRRDFWKTLPLGTVVPAFFIAIGFLQQNHRLAALSHDWLVFVLAFVVGGLIVYLPRMVTLGALVVVVIAAAGVSTVTRFDALALMCSVLAGFFFGVCVRSLTFQWKRWKHPEAVKG